MIGRQISHYRLVGKLGAGTYGEVYEGVHLHDEELRVAVKLVAPALARDAHFVDALKRECRQLDRMNHPSIVRFRELVVDEGGVAMVLELLRGQDLHDRLASGPIQIDAAASVVEAILDGLRHAHAAGVLHRDIKPGNVYWCDDGRIVVLDFGIARAADGTQATKTGHMVGTLDYMAPERMAGSGGAASSDVYAVGLIAWELVAGRAACPDGEVARKLMWHMVEGVGDGAKVAAALGCPAWFADVIAMMAAKDPAARPPDGAAALALLRERRAGAGGIPSAGPSGRRPPPLTVMGPSSVGSVPIEAASVAPVSVPPSSTGRSAPPGTVMGPESAVPAVATAAPTLPRTRSEIHALDGAPSLITEAVASWRLIAAGSLVAFALLLAGLFAFGRSDNLVYYWTPTELHAAGARVDGHVVRIGGLVKRESVTTDGNTTLFVVTDGHEEVRVRSSEIPPQMFRECIGVVVEGTVGSDQVFESRKMLVKHDENYQAPGGFDDECPHG